jgi:hypothetical protein
MFALASLALSVGQLEGEEDEVPVLEAASLVITIVGSAEQEIFARAALLGTILPRGT